MQKSMKDNPMAMMAAMGPMMMMAPMMMGMIGGKDGAAAMMQNMMKKGGKKNECVADQKKCSVHGKMRTIKNLEEDGDGGWKCSAGLECQEGGAAADGSGADVCSI